MFCRFCGAPNEDGSKFCGSCGKSLAVEQPVAAAQPVTPEPPKAPVQPAQPQPAQPQQPVQPQPQAQAAQPKAAPTQQPKKSNNKVAIIIIVAIVAFWIILFIIGAIVVGKFIGGVIDGASSVINEAGTIKDNIEKDLDDLLDDDGSYTFGNKNDKDDKGDKDDKDKDDKTQETKVLGTGTYGYITAPSDWVKFVDVDGNSTEQYSTLDGKYIITLFSVDGITAEQYANGVYASLEEDGVSGLSAAKVTFAGYDSYQVYCYYPDENIYLVTWQFETGDGKAHYVAYEGPDTKYYDVAETFSLTK